MCMLCPDSRPEELRKTQDFSPLFGFHAQVLLNATCFAKFGDIRPFEGMVCVMLAHVSR